MQVSALSCCYSSDLQTVDAFTWLNTHTREKPAPTKRELPAFLPHGVFRQRGRFGLVQLSGWVQIDVDAKQNEHVPAHLWAELAAYFAHEGSPVTLAQISASGAGFFGLVRVDVARIKKNTPAQIIAYPSIAGAALDYADEQLKTFAWLHELAPFKIDTTPSNSLPGLRFPGVGKIYLNPDVRPLP